MEEKWGINIKKILKESLWKKYGDYKMFLESQWKTCGDHKEYKNIEMKLVKDIWKL